jgi:putative PEP-CTERM system TPR-repeat lipoprotein
MKCFADFRATLVSVVALIAVGAIPNTSLAKVASQDARQMSPEVKSLVLRARDAKTRGDLRIAAILLKNAAQSDPGNAAIKAELGTILVMQGQMPQAERTLRQARSQGAPDANVLPALFQAMLAQHESQAVLDQFPEPAGKSQTASDTLRARALAYFSLNQPQLADQEIDKALAIGRQASLLVNKAEFAIARGDRLTADNLTNEALKIAPQDRTALIMKIGLLERRDAYADSLVYANKLVDSSHGDVLPLILRIEVLAKLRRDKEAQADVDRLLKTAPNLPIARYDQALLLARKGNIKQAWQIAQALSPEFVHSAPQFGVGFANIARASGNAELSDAALSAVVSTYPGNEEARLELAQRRIAQNNYNAALALLQPIENSRDWRVMASLGRTYKGLGQASKAVSYFSRANAAHAAQAAGAGTVPGGQTLEQITQAFGKDPQNADLTGTLVVLLIGQGRAEDARAIVDRFDKAAPRNPMTSYFRAQIAMATGDLDAAAKGFTNTLQTLPAYVPALYYRAQVSAARGDLTAANADLDAILRSDPGNNQALSKKAQLAILAGRDDAALGFLQRAAAASGTTAEPQIALAEFYLARGKYAQALQIAAGAQAHFPQDLRVASIAVRTQLALHAADKAKAVALKTSLANPNSAQAQLLLAGVLEKSGDSKGAAAAYQAAVHAEPKSHQSYSALTAYYLRTGQKDKAVETAQLSTRQMPDSDSDLLLADALLKSGNSGAARAVLEKSVAARPNGRVMLALVSVQLPTDRKGAKKRLIDWIAAHDRDVGAHTQLANLLMADGDIAGARSHLEQAIRYQPYNASALNDLAWAVQHSDPARAIKLATQAAKLSPRSGEILDTLAWLKWQQNNRAESLTLLQRAHALSPSEPNIAYHLALALDGTGNRAAAQGMLQAALKPNSGISNRGEAQSLQAKWSRGL